MKNNRLIKKSKPQTDEERFAIYETKRDKFIKMKHNELENTRRQRGDEFYHEVLEFIKINLHDYERRCNEYWEMFYKSIFCIALFLSLPYFIHSQPELNDFKLLTFVFPVLSCLISAFSWHSLHDIHNRNLKFNLQIRMLSTYLCTAFAEPDLPIIDKSDKYMNKLKRFRITDKTELLFLFLIIVSLLEIAVLIFSTLNKHP
jgi:hypothetical protein